MRIKASLAITVFNEEKTLPLLLSSLLTQTKRPDEIIIVDAGSTDKSQEIINKYKAKHIYFRKNLSLIIAERTNRPKGRNIGIKRAKYDVVATTDAGCILDENWFQEITAPFTLQSVEVVSGYYSYKANSIFQKCLAPYVLVMPDRVNKTDFLPSARSMAFRKSVWHEVGGFPEDYPLNEDYVFANNLKKSGEKFYFAEKAIVLWLPRENLTKSLLMFFYFATGDAEAFIIRPKIIVLFARYLLGIFLLFLALFWESNEALGALLFFFAFYVIWSIRKNYRYVRHPAAFLYLPVLQILSDVAVITGTLYGTSRRMMRGKAV